MAGPHLPLAGCPHVLRQRQPDGGERAGLENIPTGGPRPTEQRPLARLHRPKFKHGELLSHGGPRTYL